MSTEPQQTVKKMKPEQVREELYAYAGIIREYRKSLDFDAVANALRRIADNMEVTP